MFLLKRLFLIAIGAAAALEADRWLSKQKTKWSPRAVTGSLLDRVNERLESKQGRSEA